MAAKFRINAQVPITQMCVDSTPKANGEQRKVKLQFAGWPAKHPPDLGAASESFIRVVDVHHDSHTHVTTFSIEPTKGAKGVAYIYDRNDEKSDASLLRVTVGEVKNHGDFENDLIAELLGRSEHPVKLWAYQRILSRENNNEAISRGDWDKLLADQPLKQITDKKRQKEWNCGGALNAFGAKYFESDHYEFDLTPYYNSFVPKKDPRTHLPTKNMISDLVFERDTISRAATTIRDKLRQKKAVTVFVVHHDGFTVSGGRINQSNLTHYLTIVGCDSAAKNFLVTDPWPTGSRMQYASGIFGNVESLFMGKMERFDTVITTSAGFRGAHDYTLLTGPRIN